MLEKINETVSFLKKHGVESPAIGIVLGTGLGHLTSHIKIIEEFSYAKIPHFPTSTVESHEGKLIYGIIGDKKVLAMQGRFHYYEGYIMQQITFPIRVMKLLGIQYLLLSNASGCLNKNWKKGELMLVEDHINLQNGNPLIGKNIDELGPRFPDMSQPYSKQLNDFLLQIADQQKIVLHKGVYVSVLGPMLETRAEYRFLKMIGADAVGMSTVPEVIVANHMNLPCAVVSVLTDECDPDHLKPVSLEQIIAVAKQGEEKLTTLFVELIKKISLTTL